jgi:REP element-mobilizing transposase RayT
MVIDNEVRLNAVGEIIDKEWRNTLIVRPGVELDQYVVMPNHLHGIIIIGESGGATRRVAPTKNSKGLISGSLGAIIGQSVAAKRINALRQTPGIQVWQRDYYEHVIRSESDLHRIREYINRNPLHWALDEENPITL